MIISIHQPAYLPWLGYFHKIAVSDLHIVLDHVQFEKNSFINRNKILINNNPTWLTIPVTTKGKFGALPIKSLEIAKNLKWRRKHWQSIQQAYKKTPFFNMYSAFLELIYKEENSFFDFVQKITSYLLECLSIETPIIYSSTMNATKSKNELVLELCKKSNATVYFSGALGKDYLEEQAFTGENIKIVYQDYKHPIYTQQPDQSFQPYLSVLDLLFRYGEGSNAIIMKNNLTKTSV